MIPINTTNLLINNFTELSLSNMSTNTCYLNQYALMEGTAKLPKIGFYFVLAALILLFIRQQIFPWLKEFKYKERLYEDIVGLSYASLIWGVLILFYFTFQLTEHQIKNYENIALWILIPLCIYGIYYNRKNIISIFGGE